MAAQYVNITISDEDARIANGVKERLHIDRRGLSQAIQFIIREYPSLTAQVSALKSENEALTRTVKRLNSQKASPA